MAPPSSRLQALAGPDGTAGDGPTREGATRRRPIRSRQGLQPVVQIIGLHVAVLGLAMLAPCALDLARGDPNARGLAIAALLSTAAGLALALATWRPGAGGLNRRQALVMTVGIWTILPAFAALPFVFGVPHAGYTDAYFEAMSGLTTTGSTVFTGLDLMPQGVLLWRAMLHWFGGLGIVIVAVAFLPAMRLGGMQFFQAVGMDVSGDVIPQATQIAKDMLAIYLGLTLFCILGYAAAGMGSFDAICHAFGTISTGGFGTRDSSFRDFGPAAEYVAIAFMALGGMPFVRFVELSRGRARPLWRDSQVRAYFGIILAATAVIAVMLVWAGTLGVAPAIRTALFHITSLLTTTGFVADNYDLWPSVTLAVLFVATLVGGCSGSTAGGIKVFHLQVLYGALGVQLRRIRNPHGVFPLHYQGRPVEWDITASIMAFFFVYLAALGIATILLSLIGLDFMTAVSAAMAAQANVGPGFGPIVGPSGTFAPLPDLAIWVLSAEMLLGRLEFLSVLVLLMPAFWRP